MRSKHFAYSVFGSSIVIGFCFLILAACKGGSAASSSSSSGTAYVTSTQSGGVTVDFAKADSSGDLTNVNTATVTGTSYAVAAHPTLQVVYVGGSNGDIYQYSVTSTGLTAIAAAVADATLTTPDRFAISPNGKFLYVVDDGAGAHGMVRTYTINQTTGELTQGGTYQGTDGGTTPDPANNIAIAPNNQWAYVTYFSSQQICAATIDSTTGELTQIGATCVAAGNMNFGIAVSQNSNMVYASGLNADIERFSINSGTGAITSVGTTTLPGTIAEVSHDMIRVGSYLYAAVNDGTVSYYTIATDGSLNAATTVTVTGYTPGGGNSIPSMGAPPTGGYLFVPADHENKIFSFTIGAGGALIQSSTAYTTNQNSPTGIGALVF